jgi:hypothetical protein
MVASRSATAPTGFYLDAWDYRTETEAVTMLKAWDGTGAPPGRVDAEPQQRLPPARRQPRRGVRSPMTDEAHKLMTSARSLARERWLRPTVSSRTCSVRRLLASGQTA